MNPTPNQITECDDEGFCTKELPYSTDREKAEPHRYWVHPDAVEVYCEDGYPGGDIATFKCPHCGVSWKSELPQ